MKPFRTYLLLLGVFFHMPLSAAPLPAPYTPTNTLRTPEQQMLNFSRFHGATMLQSATQAFVATRPQRPQTAGPCHSLAIYPLAASGVGSAQAQQILSRRDAGLSCTGEDFFGQGLLFLDDGRLVVAAPGLTRGVPGETTGSGDIFFFRPVTITPGAPPQWQYDGRISGADLGILALGDGLASDGQRLFMFEYTEGRFSTVGPGPVLNLFDIRGVTVVARDRQQQWQRQSVLVPSQANGLEPERFFLSGDQVLIHTRLFDPTQSFVTVFEEQNTMQGDWLEVQHLDTASNTHAPAELRDLFIPLQVSGDWYITTPVDFSPAFDGNALAAIFRRDAAGLWRFHQLISVIGTEQDLGISLADTGLPFLALSQHSAALNGADLIISWIQRDSSAELIHYRLTADQTFHAVQQLEPISNVLGGSPTAILNQRHLLIPDSNGDLRVFQRNRGSSFIINRGLSGGWWFGPQRSGQGVGLEILPNDRIQMVWLSHDLSGQQLWSFGAGEIDVDRVRMDLFQPVGATFGTDFDSNSVQRLPWGQVELVFSSCEQGELRYQSDLYGSGTLALLRLSKVDGLDCGEATASPLARRWTGSWFDPSHNGEGLMMHVTPSRLGPRLSALWMTYQPDGRQAALYTASDIDSVQAAHFSSVIRPTGLNFDGSGLLQRNPWGEFELSMTQCDRSLLNYQSTLAEYGSGQLDLLRFTRPLGSGCF